MNLRKFVRTARRNGASLQNVAAVRALASVHYRINERAEIARIFARWSENGRIGVCRSGMDCDCTQYRSERVIDVPHVLVWQIEEEKHREWLDGPESVWFVTPSECRDGYHASADRALEAYENGHPGYVTWGDM
jgi:hypothetical protein